MSELHKPEFDINLQYWKVRWGKATFWFKYEKDANEFYEEKLG